MLFSWDDVETRPEPQRFELALDALPDDALLTELRKRRGAGRNDFPVAAMWRAVIAGIVFQHASVESLLRELNRNLALLDLCGLRTATKTGTPSSRHAPQPSLPSSQESCREPASQANVRQIA